MSLDNRTWFQKGLKDGIPIALGYFAVSFTLGITAKNAGLTALQAMLASFTLNASAGEFAGFTLIAAGAGYLEIAIMEFVANARYLLMSCALSQKLSPDTPLWQRLLIGYDRTDAGADTGNDRQIGKSKAGCHRYCDHACHNFTFSCRWDNDGDEHTI